MYHPPNHVNPSSTQPPANAELMNTTAQYTHNPGNTTCTPVSNRRPSQSSVEYTNHCTNARIPQNTPRQGRCGDQEAWQEALPQKDEQDGQMDRIGADFHINPDGTLHTAYYGKFVGDNLPLDGIRAFLQ